VKLVSRLLVSSRPVSWINTAFPFAVTYFMTSGQVDANLLVGFIFFLIPYNLLMYGINDVFDYESDLANPRKGGIEGALLEPKYHLATLSIASLLSAPFVIYLFAAGNQVSSVVLTGTLFAVVAYSAKYLRLKEIPVLDSFTSAVHFVGPLVFGWFLANHGSLETPLVVASAAFLLWGMASHAFGAVQDIRADRQANISSIATFFGARTTVRLAFAAYLIAAVGALFLPGRYAFAALAIVPYLFVVGREFNITDDNCELANRGWKRFIWLNFFAGAVISSLLIGPS